MRQAFQMIEIYNTENNMADNWSGRGKPSATNDFLLKEDSFYLLLETGDKIVLAVGEEWSTRSKETSDSYSTRNKPS